jgi:hypothetical protein
MRLHFMLNAKPQPQNACNQPEMKELFNIEDPFTGPALTVDQVWKLGAKIHDTDKAAALAV